ncbi:DNA polymerase III subunit gamma/tau [Candidatus Peregrinibacteria bacterium]|nr:DNA polymerase III subunit gamma/tau [Candidatus Peregrinibacteria bacterium]
MADVSLYRKYRPQNFKNLVGQDHIRTTILNALQSGHTAHAYLFCGPRGTGKTSTARLLAKALNCLNPSEEGEPCDTCELCVSIRESNLIDLIEIDAASNRGIDEIRDLKDKINFAPTRAKNKIYIIDEVHMLTKEAFNALLKTLEEPPEHVFFVLATTEAHKVPETIISRCQRFDFKRITKKAIATRLMYIAQMEEIEAEQAAVDAIAHTAEGGLRDAIGLLEQLTTENVLTFERVREVLGISGQSALESFYKHLAAHDTKSALAEIEQLYAQGLDLIQFTKDFLEFLRQKMITATQQNDTKTTTYVLHIINVFQEAYGRLKTTTIPQLPLEMATIECTTLHANTQQPQETQAPSEHSAPSAPSTSEKTSPFPAPTPMPTVDSKTEKQEQATVKPQVDTERSHQSIKANISEQDRDNPTKKLPLTISYVKENWTRIVELIKTPFARMSFKEGRPVKVEQGVITIEFTSSFHKETIDTNEIKVEIEKALHTIFNETAKVEFQLRKVDLSTKQSSSQSKTPDTAHKSSPDGQETREPSITAQEAVDMFGGELIED